MKFRSGLQRERTSESGSNIHVGGVLVSKEEWKNMTPISLSKEQYTSTELYNVRVGHVFIFKSEKNSVELPFSNNKFYRLSAVSENGTVELTEIDSNETFTIESVTKSKLLSKNNPIVGDSKLGLRFVQDHSIATILNQETKTLPYTI